VIVFLLLLLSALAPARTAFAAPDTPAAADSAAAPARDSLAVPDSARAADDAPRTAARDSMPAPVLTLPEVRVDREHVARDARATQPTGFTSDLRAGDTGHALETVVELLGRAAGVRVQQYGGLGSFATVSLRGAPASQLSVYLDGVPLTSASGSVVDLSSLPATAIDHIEIYRGVAPIALGPPTPGGAIDIITLPSHALSRLAVTRGSFGTWQGAATAGVRRGGWSALGHAGWQASRGDFGYRDDNGTPFNAADDADATRVNARFDARSALATVRGPLPGGATIVLRQSLVRRDQGVPGLGAVPAQHTRLATDRALGSATIERPRGAIAPAVSVEGAVDRGRTRFRDALAELGAGRTDTDDHTGSEQLRVIATTPPLARTTLELSGLARREHARLHDAASGRPDPPRSARTTRGASVLLAAEPWRGVLLRAGRRWDRETDALRWTTSLGQAGRSDVARTLDAPQLGARVRLPGVAALGVTLKANWSRSQRAPEFVELFGNEGSVRGNPALTPERSENWDAGGGVVLGPARGVRATVEYAHWEQHARDLIVYAKNSASSVRALNVSRARLRGEELSARIGLPYGAGVTGWCTWQGTLDQGAVPAWRGRALPQRPERHAAVEASWSGAHVDVAGDLEYLGGDWLDRANRQRAPSRTFAGLTLGVRPRRGTRVALEVKNLGDTRASDVAGFPLPGRSIFVTCEWGAAPRLP